MREAGALRLAPEQLDSLYRVTGMTDSLRETMVESYRRVWERRQAGSGASPRGGSHPSCDAASPAVMMTAEGRARIGRSTEIAMKPKGATQPNSAMRSRSAIGSSGKPPCE